MKKHPLPAWAGCLLLIVLTIVGTMRLWQPITAESGVRSTRVLMKANATSKTISLDFGNVDNYRLPRTSQSEALLSPDAIGREYNITSVYHHKRGTGDYHEVYALYGIDGRPYLTIAESEASRQAQLPLRLTLFVVLDVFACGLVIWSDRRRKKAAAANAPIPDEPQAEEESP